MSENCWPASSSNNIIRHGGDGSAGDEDDDVCMMAPSANESAIEEQQQSATPAGGWDNSSKQNTNKETVAEVATDDTDNDDTNSATVASPLTPADEAQPKPRRRKTSTSSESGAPSSNSNINNYNDGAAGGGGSDEEDEPEEQDGAADGEPWKYVAPPKAQRTFDFFNGEASPSRKLFCRISSEFCSGNLFHATRVSETVFDLQVANDNHGAPCQTGNKMWFFFSVSGIAQGTTLTFNLTSMPFVKSYNYGFTPCVSVDPIRPTFSRMAGSVTMTTAPLPPGVNPRTKKSNDPQYVNIAFDYCFDATARAGSPAELSSKPLTYYFAFGHPYSYEKLQRQLTTWSNNYGPDITTNTANRSSSNSSSSAPSSSSLSSASDRSSSTAAAGFAAAGCVAPPRRGSLSSGSSSSGVTTPSTTSPASAATTNSNNSSNQRPKHAVMYRELLTRTLDGHRVDLITITARPSATTPSSSCSSSPSSSPSKLKRGAAMRAQQQRQPSTEPCFGPDGCFPLSSSSSSSSPPSSPSFTTRCDGNPPEQERGAAEEEGSPSREKPRRRPLLHPNKKYVLLTARVHPGEVPASHVMHGCIDFLLNNDDPRAIALRENFVFVVVPMVNPDGVVRGNTRADSCGCNLNRMYKTPTKERHPTIFAIRELMLHLAGTGRLALYVDMHAHANKRGAFFYGNALHATKQVENLLFTKLVSMNSPYFMFNDCNFTQSNMYSLGKTGICRDGSGRVAAFLETGLVHSYTLECNSIIGPPINGIAPIPKIPSEDGTERMAGTQCQRYVPSTFHDIAKGILCALLDHTQLNPASRIPQTEFRTLAALRNFIAAAIYSDALEQAKKKRNEFVVTKDDPPIDVDADGPVTTVFGPRMPLPPTTTSGGIGTLQGALANTRFMAPLRTRQSIQSNQGGGGGRLSAAAASAASGGKGARGVSKVGGSSGAGGSKSKFSVVRASSKVTAVADSKRVV